MNRNILNQGSKINNNIYINALSGTLPLEVDETSSTSATVSIKGLSDIGSAGQIIRVNSAGDALEYGSQSTSSNWTVEGTDLVNLNQATIDFVEMKRTDSGQVGFKLTNSAYSSELKQLNDDTIIKTANSKLKFTDQNIEVNNYLDRNIIKYVNSSSRIDLGNPTDTISLINGSATLTLPASTGTVALTSQIPTNNNQLTNGAGYITGSSPAITTPTITSPTIDNIKNSSTRDIMNYAGTRLTIGNTNTDTVYIDRCSNILVDVGRRFMESNLTANILTIGNPTDTISLINGTATLTLPASTGTVALFSQIPTNNNQLTNGAGYITGSSPTITTPTITSPTIDNIKNSSTRNIMNYSGTRLTIGNTTTDTVYIDRCSHILVDFGRRFMESNLTANILTIGNPTDTISLVNGSATLTLPTSTGTVALTDDILFQEDGGSIRPKVLTNTYIQNKRNTSASSGFRATNLHNSVEQSAYFYLDSTTKCNIESPAGIIKLSQATGLLDLQYSNDRTIVTNSATDELTFGNVSDKIIIQHDRFELRDRDNNILLSSVRPANNMTYNAIIIGKGASTTTPEERPLVLMSSATNPTFRDCRFQMRNVNTSGGSNPVIELLQNTSGGYKGGYIYMGDGGGDLYLESSTTIKIRTGSQNTAEFDSGYNLKFLQTSGGSFDQYSNIKGSITSTHPHNSTARMNNIFCNEVVCTSAISQNNSISHKAFQSKYLHTSIEGFNSLAPSATRKAFLELGTSQSVPTNTGDIYPLARYNSPVLDAEWYNYIQTGIAPNPVTDYMGWAYSDSSNNLTYYIQFGSDNVLTYKPLTVLGDFIATGTKSFRIRHPIKEEAEADKVLYHTCIEAPRCDNIYSGKVQLQDGKATVDLDVNEWYKMTPGTFVKLNKDLRVYVNNNDFGSWDLVKGKVEGNKLIIVSNNPESTVMVDWMVVGTRQDREIIESGITDEFGNLITEHIEVQDEDTKSKVKSSKKSKEDYRCCKYHSLFKSLSNRLTMKTKTENGLHTARQLLKNNLNVTKSNKTNQPFMCN